jgi:hypothetical protein
LNAKKKVLKTALFAAHATSFCIARVGNVEKRKDS